MFNSIKFYIMNSRYHYELLIQSRKSCKVLRTKNYGTNRTAALMAEAKVNADVFGDVYATVEVVWDTIDLEAERVHEQVARMRKW